MKKNILLSIDVFNPDPDLLKYGVYTAKNLGATLILFDAHYKSVVIPNDITNSNQTVLQVVDTEKKIEIAKQKLATIYKQLSEEWYFTRAKLVTDAVPAWKGDKEYYLIEEIKEITPTMVIMEVKSDFSYFNELFGTPETKVVETANCPVTLPIYLPFLIGTNHF